MVQIIIISLNFSYKTDQDNKNEHNRINSSLGTDKSCWYAKGNDLWGYQSGWRGNVKALNLKINCQVYQGILR